ncbi:cyclic nucleotide-binding domain-containing protein [Breznakiella homolactica]|uniref:ATP-binding protein n=1 Tax=Breznakiella homolactica TaxID=2798577 RepID=A0A7T7XP63_9SPIR|nr:cyclic nucleotide-binding domain-containing protein [Breznakiella homolactica]QQO09939.1 ATP-binding protein [Breznakiella homolactica]
MSVLGIINSDPDIKKRIQAAFTEAPSLDLELKFLSEKEAISEFLNYEMPEIVIINFSDPKIDIPYVAAHIKNDKWLLNFGIVGIFNSEKDSEEKLLAQYKDINVLAILDYYRLRSHLVKNIEIIMENYQIIFQREFTKDIIGGVTGSFTLENDLLAVPLYASIGATILAQRGFINPDSKMHLQLALDELLVNAIEHGNCAISFEEKTAAMEEGKSVVDLVNEKCQNPRIRVKKVEFQWDIRKDKTIFTIRDKGKGFDVAEHLKKIEEQDIMSLHGRGIRMASMFSSSLKYNKKGNQVKLTVLHDASVERKVPAGFSREQLISVKKGETVLWENESSDYLYYISSGKYSVYHDKKLVGSLTAQDIFMGEMSFLLNQKRSASVKADGPGKLVRLSRKNFINIIRQYPHYGIFLSRLLAKRLVRSNEQNAKLSEQLNI